jgi:RNA polymerase sigma-70 factor (ECF subfamily)
MGGPPRSESFADLLAAARERDERAWSALYHRFAPPLLGFLRGSGADDAEDLLGEVFLQAVRGLDGFRGDQRAFRAWMFTLANHRLVDAKRRSRRRPLTFMAQVPHPPDTRRGPAEEAGERADVAHVLALLAGLAPDQRAVLLLRLVGDLTVAEIARVVGKRRGAVKALQRRGLAALERQLGREAYPFPALRRLQVGDSSFVPRHG